MRAAASLALTLFLIAATVQAAGGDAALWTCATLLRDKAAEQTGSAKADLLLGADLMEKAAKGSASPLLADLPPRPEAPPPQNAADCLKRYFPGTP